jgi:hypothetical protein
MGNGKLYTLLYYKGKNWDNVDLMGKTLVKSGVGILKSCCINIKTDFVV